MDAAEYLEVRSRMVINCDEISNKVGCDNCRWDKICHGTTKEVVAIVEKWAKENPAKSYADKFLEMFPNATLHYFCVSDVFGKQYGGADWDEEYKELS